jgi:CheY-like chemotaxis protein
MKDNRPVLLVEDDVVDRLVVKRAFKDLDLGNPIEVAINGEAALAYLRNPEHPRPCFILLDLNMPRLSGLEFLKAVKADEELKAIPVVVLTTSRDEQDRQESFRLGVAGYLVKPVEYERFIEMVRTLTNYWALSEVPT